VDPADGRCGKGDGVVYVRGSVVARSPVGDKGLGSLENMLRFGGDHKCWRLIAQVGIHTPEPRANRLGRVVLEKQANHLVGIPQAPLGVRMGGTKSAGPLTNCLGVVDAGHNGGQTLWGNVSGFTVHPEEWEVMDANIEDPSSRWHLLAVALRLRTC